MDHVHKIKINISSAGKNGKFTASCPCGWKTPRSYPKRIVAVQKGNDHIESVKEK